MARRTHAQLRQEGFTAGVNLCYAWLIHVDELSLAEQLEKGLKIFNRSVPKEERIKLNSVPYPPFDGRLKEFMKSGPRKSMPEGL
jgi:hypothetical protein